MIKKISHPTYGEIVYYESFLTGKKKVSVGGNDFQKVSSRNFVLQDGTPIAVKGSFLFGSQLIVGQEIYEITPKIKWYEWLPSVIIFALMCAWGNSPLLVSVVPIVGGVIGGAISGLFGCIGLLGVRMFSKWPFKALSVIVCAGLNFLICYLIGMALLKSAGLV